MTVVLTTLLVSGTVVTASPFYLTGSAFGQQQATLRVVKNLICELPSPPCPIVPSNFRMQVTGNNPIPASFNGSSQGTVVTLGPGEYDVSESTPPPAPPGLTLVTARSTDCTGNISEGDSRTCIMTNAYLSPNGDADGDGLRNTWEINGIDANGDNRIDFRLLQADPLHKNLYIEVDYMEFHRPAGGDGPFGIIQDVKRAFTNAPVGNPDGITGVNLFLLLDEQITHQDAINGVTGLLAIKRTNFGTVTERADPNSVNLLNAKRLAFHYGPFVHDRSDLPGSSGVSNGAPGMEFFVSLGGNWGLAPMGPMGANHSVGTRDQQAGTFIHELGHNLRLGHGGDPTEDRNCEPNYFSVMSYSFQMSNWVPGRPLDYSRSALATLNETNLNEPNGISQSTPSGLRTVYGPTQQEKGPRTIATAGVPIDWNFNGRTTDTGVESDINGLRDGCGLPGPGQIATGFNDWANLVYTSTPAEQLAPLQIQQLEVPDEMTIDDVRDSRLALLLGIDNGIQRLIGTEPESTVEFNTTSMAELLQTDQLDAAIAELLELRTQVIDVFGPEAANREVVP
jgi:hypothetical protein